MTLLAGDRVTLRPDGTSSKVLVDVDGEACTHIPKRLVQRSSVLQDLHTTSGCAPLPFPASWLEIWSQYVDGASTVDWLVRAMKVSHFLQDQPTCLRAASQLASEMDVAKDWTSPYTSKLLEALDGLGADLLDLVFQHSTLPLHVALVELPASLHACAVRAGLQHGRQLDLSRRLRCSMVPSLGHQVALMSSCINHLDVSFNHLGLRAATDLTLVLASLKGLTFLSLESTAIGDSGLAALAPYLKRLQCIRHLSLADTALTAESSRTLAAVLTPLTSLQHLDLSSNAFDVEGHVVLAPVLATLTALSFLDNVGGKFSMRAPAPPTVCPPALFKLEQLGLQVHSTAPEDVCSVSLPLMRFRNLHTLRLHFEHSSQSLLCLRLTALEHLRHFTLGASAQGALDADAVLAPLTTLTLLHVSAFQIGDAGRFLTGLSALANLSLHKAFGDDAGADADDPILSPYLTALSALTALSLESNAALGPSFDALGHSLAHLSNLEILRFRDNHECSDAAASSLFAQLATLSTLKVLDLDNSWLPESEAAELAESLQNLPLLEHLNVSTNPLWDDGALALVAVLPRLPHLTFLNLSETSVSSYEVSKLLAALCHLTALRALNVASLCDGRDHKTGPAGAFELSSALRCLPCLESLNVAANDFGHGFAALAPALGALPLLTKLVVGDQPLPGDCAPALGAALARLTILQFLDMSGMSPEVVQVFTPGSSNAWGPCTAYSALTELVLSGCDLSDVGVAEIGPSVACMSSLVRLGLARNRLTDLGVHALARHLAGLQDLRSVNFRSNEGSTRGYVLRMRDPCLQEIAVF